MADVHNKAHEVLETYELLENIITLIDTPRKIFVIQRVCKDWRSLIVRSGNIQRLLFLAPEKAPVAPRTPKQPNNPASRATEVTYEHKFAINNLLEAHDPAQAWQSKENTDLFEVNVSLLHTLHKHHTDDSYRKQYLTQPPCTVVKVGALRSGGREMGGYVGAIVRDPDGVKLSALENFGSNVATDGGSKDAEHVKLWVYLTSRKTDELEAIRTEWVHEERRRRRGECSFYLHNRRWTYKPYSRPEDV